MKTEFIKNMKIDEVPNPEDFDIYAPYFGRIEDESLIIWSPGVFEKVDDSFRRIRLTKNFQIELSVDLAVRNGSKFDPVHLVRYQNKLDSEKSSYFITSYTFVHSKYVIIIDKYTILVSFTPINMNCKCHQSIEEFQFERLLKT
jgi:hypothetical protein